MENRFKVWDNKHREWLQVQDGYIYFRNDGKIFGFQCTGMGENLLEFTQPEGYVKVNYTTLKDKHGKPIYGGDIGKLHNESIICVVWNKTLGGWSFECFDEFDDGVGSSDFRLTKGIADNTEIIGNIYENKELLK